MADYGRPALAACEAIRAADPQALIVGPATSELPLSTDQVIIGTTALGESRALGGQVRLSHSTLTVTLYCEESETPTGRPWTQEAARRLERHILPLLKEQALYLQLWLVFANRDASARVSSSQRQPCLLYTSTSPRNRTRSRMQSSA